MRLEDFKNFLNLIQTFRYGLEMELDTKTHFFDPPTSNSGSFEEEYKLVRILNKVENLLNDIIEINEWLEE